MKKHLAHFRSAAFACLLTLLLSQLSCTRQPAKNTLQQDKTGSADIRYAKGFTIDYYRGYQLLRVFSGSGSHRDTISYVLLSKGATLPQGYSKAQVIRVPVRSLVAMSSTHIAQADFAGVANVIVGIGSFNYVSSTVVRNNIAAGKVKEAGVDGTMNNELLIQMRPDLVMVMATADGQSGKYTTLTEAGVPVLQNGEWLENSPLGRAEWVKLMAALSGREQQVNARFAAVEKEYQRLALLGRSAQHKPTVITGMPYKGVWNVPAGDSYQAQFFKDAGASYKWMKVRGTGSLPLNFETVAPEALHADFWVNPGYVNSRKDIAGTDLHYADFKPFTSGRVFNYNKRVNAIGSNDYWESGVVNPQVILADLIAILHPELLPGRKLYYYQQLN